MMDRTSYIGGSDVASILGISPWKSAYSLYLEKIGDLQQENDPKKEKIFSRGKRLEPVVIEMLVDELKSRGHEVEILERNKRYQHPEFPFLACEIDVELRIDGEEMNGEIKTVHPFAAKDWGNEGTDEIPLYYTAQVAHGLMIKPRKRAIVAALIGADDLRIHFVDQDQELIDLIMKKEIAFWQRVQDRDPPEPSNANDIKYLYARDQGLVIDADEELAALCVELKGHKNTLKSLESMIDEISTRIKLKMGDASLAIYEGRKICSWSSNKDSKSVDWKSIAMSFNPDANLIAMHTIKKAGNRPLLIK